MMMAVVFERTQSQFRIRSAGGEGEEGSVLGSVASDGTTRCGMGRQRGFDEPSTAHSFLRIP